MLHKTRGNFFIAKGLDKPNTAFVTFNKIPDMEDKEMDCFYRSFREGLTGEKKYANITLLRNGVI